jgi:hypothetical protein
MIFWSMIEFRNYLSCKNTYSQNPNQKKHIIFINKNLVYSMIAIKEVVHTF